jgi:O-antigen/teichoic acid export membrane protein
MISKLLALENVAYYAVAVFIAAVIDTPSRAMFQIVNPLVSKAISNNDKNRLEELLKKSSMSLFLISGLIFLLINTNIGDIYNVVESINKIQGYSIAIPVVLIISISKLYTSTIGCMNNIISNSNFYQYILFFSIFSALSLFFLNIYFIENIGLIGAAYSTLIIIVVFNLLKIILVLVKLKIQPYSINSIKLFFIITVLYLIFSNLEFDFLSAISSLIIKSIIISIIYMSICYYLNISKEINNVINSFIKKIRPEKGNQA